MLEVFNTLLRQLRLSGDYELTGSYDGNTNIGTKIIKAHEERQLQEAVIRTIGGFPTSYMRTHLLKSTRSVSSVKLAELEEIILIVNQNKQCSFFHIFQFFMSNFNKDRNNLGLGRH